MLYLIESVWHDKKADKIIDLVKIGYTENFKKRWTSYKLHNPLCVLLDTIEDGTEDDEKRLHYHFKDLIYPDYGKEWFIFDQSIIEFFNTHRTSSSLSSLPIDDETFRSKDEILKDWLDKNREELSKGVIKWLDEIYFKEGTFIKRLKSFCEVSYLTMEDKDFLLNKLPIELHFKEYYQTLGPERCKAFGYEKNKLEKELELQKFDKGGIRGELDFIFKEGEIYTLKEIKEKLGTLYNTLGYKKTPKATDLKEYYEIKDCKKRINKKLTECYKIIKKL